VNTRVGRVKQFLLSIHDGSNRGLASLTFETFVDYVSGINGRYSSIGKTNILYTIKNYFACPHIHSQLTFDPSPFLTNLHTNKHERLRSCYTPDEIGRVLQSVDRSVPKGKMHYLMMLLAGLYGLRSCDIRTMKLSNIDWKRRLIVIDQHKTKRYLELPIIQEVLLAMLDYIKNGRPVTTDPHVFIRQRMPCVPYSEDNHFSSKISYYFKKAGIATENKRSGLHSMRHSLATALFAGGVQIHEIAGVLGHASPQSTTLYLWSDIDQLRNAALEVDSYGK
jgi:integrase